MVMITVQMPKFLPKNRRNGFGLSINNNFSYNSGTNSHFMKINEIRKLISDLDKKI